MEYLVIASAADCLHEPRSSTSTGRAATIFEEACNREPNAADVNAEENRACGCSLLGALYLAAERARVKKRR